MAVYVVAYRIDPTHVTHAERSAALALRIGQILPTFWHNTPNLWLAVSDDTPDLIRADLKRHLVPGDDLLIMAVTRPTAWFGFSPEANAWLQENL